MFDPVEAIKELVRFPSISTDSSSQEAMEGTRRCLGCGVRAGRARTATVGHRRRQRSRLRGRRQVAT